MTHHRKIDLSMFRDDDEDDLIIAPKGKVPHPTIFIPQELTIQRQVELTDLKSRTFNHGKLGKTKKDLEKEAEEKKRIEEEKCVFHTTHKVYKLITRAQALVMAEYEEAFERPQYGFNAGRGSGFVRAGGESPSIVVVNE
jgi:U2-associated protein SR140